MKHLAWSLTFGAVFSFVGACAGGLDGADDGASDDDATDATNVDAAGCHVFLSFDPQNPKFGIDPALRVTANADAGGNLDYDWTVIHNGHVITTENADPNSSVAIRFPLDEAGIYEVQALIPNCSSDQESITVMIPTATRRDERIRIVPPAAMLIPPSDRIYSVYAGTDAAREFALDPGIDVTSHVKQGGAGVAAYLKFSPIGLTGASTEAFTGSAGDLDVQLLAQSYSVLVIPVSQAVAPTRIAAWNALTAPDLTLTAGTAISGTVRAPDNSPVAGATVQLTIDGVPSTYATTSATGAFTVHADSLTGAVTVAVVPPTSTGLPRLEATSSLLDLAQPLAITYSPTLVVRDLAGVHLDYPGGLAQAAYTVSGTLTGAGAIQTGATTATATGTVRASGTTTGDALPTTRVAAGALAVAIVLPPHASSVAALDVTTSVPSTVSLAAMAPFAPTITNATGAPLAGIAVDAVPIGALAAAQAPTLHFTTNANGIVQNGLLGAGGRYQLRLADPHGRAATRIVETGTSSISATYALPKGVKLQGTLRVPNGAALTGAAVQILCGECTGVDRDRPIAETSSVNGVFTLVIPDPDSP